MLVMGVDPGLATTGWGVIVADGNRIAHIGNGRIRTDAKLPLAQRLAAIGVALNELVIAHAVVAGAVEEVFVNDNPQSTLKLAQARGVALGIFGFHGLGVGEYAPRVVKQGVVGTGTADKAQVHAMVKRLLPGVAIDGPDAADALAVAITHVHHARTAQRREPGEAGA